MEVIAEFILLLKGMSCSHTTAGEGMGINGDIWRAMAVEEA